MHKLFPVVVAVATLHAHAAAQDPETRRELQELRQRVDELEEQQAKTADRLGGRALLQAYTARSVDVGGHLTTVFASMIGNGSTETGHLVSFVELYLKAEIDDRWSVFATPGFYTFDGGLVDDPATPATTGDPLFTASETGLAGTVLSRAYGEYAAGDRLQVQAGIVGSLHGTNREYFIPTRVIAAGSLHTRYFVANQLYPEQVLGVRGTGKLPIGAGHRVEYVADFGPEAGSPAGGRGGARLAWHADDAGATIAANYGRGTREGFPIAPSSAPAPLFTGNVPVLQAPFTSRFNLSRDYEFGGLDVELRCGAFVARTEAYYSAERDVEDQRVLSQQVNWFVDDSFTVSYRFDYYDAGADLDPLGTTVRSLGHATEHVVGLCWCPREGVRVRLDVHHQLLPNSDETIDFVNLSWSLSF